MTSTSNWFESQTGKCFGANHEHSELLIGNIHLRDADHSKRNFPVTASMSAFLPGPIAGTVLDPANT